LVTGSIVGSSGNSPNSFANSTAVHWNLDHIMVTPDFVLLSRRIETCYRKLSQPGGGMGLLPLAWFVVDQRAILRNHRRLMNGGTGGDVYTMGAARRDLMVDWMVRRGIRLGIDEHFTIFVILSMIAW
jgi:hypothetical protein